MILGTARAANWVKKDMHAAHQAFIDAIARKQRVSLRYFDRKQGRERVRICAPLDFGPLRGSVDGADRYQLWDLGAKHKPFNVAVLPSDIVELTVLPETFEPEDFITWAFKPNAWRVPRDWGKFS